MTTFLVKAKKVLGKLDLHVEAIRIIVELLIKGTRYIVVNRRHRLH